LPAFVFAAVSFAIVVVAHTVWRFVSSRGTERQQTKWFVFAAASFPVLFGAGVGLGVFPTLSTLLVMAGFLLGLNGMAAAIGIAVLRYRLYDIDRVISRAVSYALLTAILGGAFAVAVLVPALLLGRSAAPDFVVAAATLVVVALFRPVRRRVQEGVDHRFNRRRYDAAQTMDVFTARLRDEIDIETLRLDLETLVLHTMEPQHVRLWIPTPASDGNSTP
jgi:hypothetical protein